MTREIHLKGGYSDRKGITHFQSAIQFCSLNDRTKNKLFEVVCNYALNPSMFGYNRTIKYIYCEMFGEVASPYDAFNIQKDILNLFLKSDYAIVFTFLEGLAQFLNNQCFTEDINNVFKDELVQHRFIDKRITDLTDEHEIEAVQLCTDYDEVSRTHIEKATQFLYNRENPDYENSIKEAISAVEAKCCEIVGKKTTLGDALKKLEENGLIIHPAMKEAFNKLFGYTSDTNGIRHGSGMDIKTTKAEAQFMLVTCAAFCNYLREYQK